MDLRMKMLWVAEAATCAFAREVARFVRAVVRQVRARVTQCVNTSSTDNYLLSLFYEANIDDQL